MQLKIGLADNIEERIVIGFYMLIGAVCFIPLFTIFLMDFGFSRLNSTDKLKAYLWMCYGIIMLIVGIYKQWRLHKPEVNLCLPLEDKQEGGNGIPPTSKEVGILPKIL